MKSKAFIIGVILAAALSTSAQVESTIKATQVRYADIAQKAVLEQTDKEQGEYGDLVMDELAINKLNHPWRAVGIHGITAKFFYTGGDSEEHMYPDELVLVKLGRSTSNRSYHEEYLYSKTGVLLYCLQTSENDDTIPAKRGFYFALGKPIRVERDGKLKTIFTADDRRAAADAISTSVRLKSIFATTIKL